MPAYVPYVLLVHKGYSSSSWLSEGRRRRRQAARPVENPRGKRKTPGGVYVVIRCVQLAMVERQAR